MLIYIWLLLIYVSVGVRGPVLSTFHLHYACARTNLDHPVMWTGHNVLVLLPSPHSAGKPRPATARDPLSLLVHIYLSHRPVGLHSSQPRTVSPGSGGCEALTCGTRGLNHANFRWPWVKVFLRGSLKPTDAINLWDWICWVLRNRKRARSIEEVMTRRHLRRQPEHE